MEVMVATEQRYDRTPDGTVWTPNTCGFAFWRRYLDTFNLVRVITRVRDVERVPDTYIPVNGASVEVSGVPHYLGPWQYLKRMLQIRRTIAKSATSDSAIILRVPGTIGTVLWRLIAPSRPYGVEVVGDPYDVFAPGGIKHPLRPLFRYTSVNNLKAICANACAAGYVTRGSLQRRYPTPAFVTGVSDVEAPEILPARTAESFAHSPIKLICVGSLETMYKSPDVVLNALRLCIRGGLKLALSWVGDGRYRKEIEAHCDRNLLRSHVKFMGQLSPAEVVRQMDSADLFLLPSRAEGLPRVMIEAMARALPCIGSTVGGIPELLPADCLVPPGDVNALAGKIQEVAKDPVRMALMSRKNVEVANEYREDRLRERRNRFFEEVKQRTREWQNSSRRVHLVSECIN